MRQSGARKGAFERGGNDAENEHKERRRQAAHAELQRPPRADPLRDPVGPRWGYKMIPMVSRDGQPHIIKDPSWGSPFSGK